VVGAGVPPQAAAAALSSRIANVGSQSFKRSWLPSTDAGRMKL